MEPIVSIISPCRNAQHYIEACIQSVLDQSLTPAEHIIVDDGSTDDSPRIAERLAAQHPSRIRVIRQSATNGNVARNAGAKLARGNLLLFLDADDLLTPHAIESFVSKSREFPSSIVLGLWDHLRLIEAVWTLTPPDLDFSNPHPDWLAEIAARRTYFVASAMLWSRAEFERVGGWDEKILAAQDLDIFTRAIRVGIQAVAMNEIVLHYRRHPKSASSVSRNFTDPALFDSRFLVYERFAQAVEAVGRTKELSSGLARRYFNLGDAQQFTNPFLATECLRRSLALGGWNALPPISFPHRLALHCFGYGGRNQLLALARRLKLR